MNMSTTKPTKSPEIAVAEAEASAGGQDLAGELAVLRKEFQAFVEQAGAAGQAAKGAATSAVRAQAAKGIEVGEHYAADLMEDWREIDRKVVEATRESPWRTLGAAAMVGLILGLILRR